LPTTCETIQPTGFEPLFLDRFAYSRARWRPDHRVTAQSLVQRWPATPPAAVVGTSRIRTNRAPRRVCYDGSHTTTTGHATMTIPEPLATLHTMLDDVRRWRARQAEADPGDLQAMTAATALGTIGRGTGPWI